MAAVSMKSVFRTEKVKTLVIDRTLLRKLILTKENEGALGYIEDLFINNVKTGASLESLYQMTVQVAMLLQEIKKEYKLDNYQALHNLPDLLETIYRADDIFGIKALFISEINEIIRYLHEEDSQYTPVVRQITDEVREKLQREYEFEDTGI